MEVNFDELFDVEIDQLYCNVGSSLTPPSLGVRPPTTKEREGLGREWLRDKMESLREVICSSNIVRLHQDSDRVKNRVVLAAAIADMIASYVSGIAGASVAVLIVREGIDTWCNPEKAAN